MRVWGLACLAFQKVDTADDAILVSEHWWIVWTVWSDGEVEDRGT